MSTALNRYLFYSLIVASIAIGTILVEWNALYFNIFSMRLWGWYLFRVGLYASAVWAAMVVVGYIRFRSAANRLLIGAPLALWWPSFQAVAYFVELFRMNR
jgi:hypothetical protein